MNIKDYFSFTKSEKRGVVFLLSLIIIIFIFLQFISLLKTNKLTNFSKFDAEINRFEKELNSHLKNDSLSKFNRNSITLPILFFDFNPNTINDSDWLKLGIKEWQVKTINNYRLKGGEFRVKSDVSKIYGLADTLYRLLYPHILLPEKIEQKHYETKFKNEFPKKNYEVFSKKEPIIIDITTADTTELKLLKGIGSAFSRRIIKYRESLGGFTSTEQLKEVYGITDDIYNQILPFVKKSSKKINKLNINEITEEDLKKHPYIDWRIAKTIIAYRSSHGNFKDVNDIKQIHLVTEEIYTKIVPYLTVK